MIRLLSFALFLAARLPAEAAGPRHVIVYQEPGRYPGWPANQGIWIWGDEIVVGFTLGVYQPVAEQKKPSLHAINRDVPRRRVQARSLDGGLSWHFEQPAELNRSLEAAPPSVLKKPFDFEGLDSALLFRFGPRGSCFYTSTDRCRTWRGPHAFEVPGLGLVTARTDLVEEGPGQCLMLASAVSAQSEEGRPFCARTTDGGISWKLVSYIGPNPSGLAIMPSTVTLNNGDLLTTIRRRESDKPAWIETWLSQNHGEEWAYLGIAAPGLGEGNPPSVVNLPDGRLCLVYGCRAQPYGIRARLSADDGRTWSDEIFLRQDALTADLGYPRSVVRADGTVITVYYFNGPRDEDRTIQATLWKP